MNKNDILTLFDYNKWANDRILAASARVTPEQYLAPFNLSHGSLRGTLIHTLRVEILWRLRCLGENPPLGMITEADYPTVETLRVKWASEEQNLRAYLTSLTDDQLVQTLKYRNTKGIPYENTFWNLLAHVVNHGTQTRSEAALALTAYGESPGDLDMLFFFRGQNTT